MLLLQTRVHVCAGAASVPGDGLPQAVRVGAGHHRQVLSRLAGAQALPRSVPRHRRTQDRALLAESIGKSRKTSDTQPLVNVVRLYLPLV